MKLLDSDEEEEDQDDREAIANELFEGDEDTPEVIWLNVIHIELDTNSSHSFPYKVVLIQDISIQAYSIKV